MYVDGDWVRARGTRLVLITVLELLLLSWILKVLIRTCNRSFVYYWWGDRNDGIKLKEESCKVNVGYGLEEDDEIDIGAQEELMLRPLLSMKRKLKKDL
jgi:hypothetical protein